MRKCSWHDLISAYLPRKDYVFSNDVLYHFEERFKKHFPGNRNVRAKIRQTLARFVFSGAIVRIAPGVYKWKQNSIRCYRCCSILGVEHVKCRSCENNSCLICTPIHTAEWECESCCGKEEVSAIH
jgi:hypothetical protein